MIRKTDYILWAYAILYQFVGWQYIVFKVIDSTTPSRFIDMISSNVFIAGSYFLIASIFSFVALSRGNIIKIIGGKIGISGNSMAKIFFIPQLLIATSSAVSMFIAVSGGQYADGTILPWHFILKDQEWTAIFWIFNLASVIFFDT